MIYKTLHRKLKTAQDEPHKKTLNSCTAEGQVHVVPAPPTNCTRGATLTTNPMINLERGKGGIVITTNRTYLCFLISNLVIILMAYHIELEIKDTTCTDKVRSASYLDIRQEMDREGRFHLYVATF